MLGASEQRLIEELIEAVPQGVALYDAELRYVAVNSRYRQEFKEHLGHEVAPGTHILEALAHLPEEREKAEALWQRALAGESFQTRLEFASPSGKRHSFVVRFHPLGEQFALPTAVVHIVSDVTGQLEAEREAKSLAELQRLALEVAEIGTWEYEVATGRISGDARAREMFETDKPYFTWEEYLGNVVPEDVEAVSQTVEQALAASHSERFSVDFRVRRKDGSIRWFRGSGALVNGGETPGWSASCWTSRTQRSLKAP